MRRVLFSVACLFATVCSPSISAAGERDALVFDRAEFAGADRIVIFVPGALTSIQLYAPAGGWRKSGFVPVYFRFPGVDGRALEPLDIGAAADDIAAFARAHPDKDVALVGYSTGAPIAIEAALRITDGRTIPVTALAPAVEHAGGLSTVLRGAGDLVTAAMRAGSLNRQKVWAEYWQILLKGRNAPPDPVLRQRLIAGDPSPQPTTGRPLGPPDAGIARAHALKLLAWRLPPDPDLSHIRLRIFAGLDDPVFSTRQTLAFARKLGQDRIYGYPGEGHMLYLTQIDVFDSAREFAVDVLEER